MLRLTTDSFAQISSTNANNDGILNITLAHPPIITKNATQHYLDNLIS